MMYTILVEADFMVQDKVRDALYNNLFQIVKENSLNHSAKLLVKKEPSLKDDINDPILLRKIINGLHETYGCGVTFFQGTVRLSGSDGVN